MKVPVSANIFPYIVHNCQNSRFLNTKAYFPTTNSLSQVPLSIPIYAILFSHILVGG